MRRQNGITLIALVITIIVLLILAGVTIAMLTGDNGILNRASEAKYDNILASVDENVKLAQLGVKTSITAEMVNTPSYIATDTTAGLRPVTTTTSTTPNFDKLVNQVAEDLGAGSSVTSSTQPEGYNVWGYIDTKGSTSQNGFGYIYITYSDNSLRSSLPTTAVSGNELKASGITFDTTTIGEQTVNQAAVVYAIEVENYDCTLCKKPFITTHTNVVYDFGTATSFKGTNKTKVNTAGMDF